MVWFVALVAVLNLGLGYAVAVYLGAARNQNWSAVSSAAIGSRSYEGLDDSEEYFDEQYEEVEDMDYEATAAG